jgi:hypothetical protein
MAQVSSGSFNTTSAEGRYLTFNWSVDNTNTKENYKEIYWSFVGAGVGGYVIGGNFKVVIDGETVYSNSTRREIWVNTVIASGKKKIYHTNNGTRSFSASVEAGIYEVAVNCRGSGTWELPTISRYAKITSFSVAKRDETSVTYLFTADSSVDYAWYSTDNGATWYGLPNNNIVSGLKANTSYNFKLRLRRTDSQLTTDSSTYSQATYNYPHCTSSPDFTIGDALTLEFYNPLGRSMTVKGYAKSNGSQIFSGTVTGNKATGFNDSASKDAQYLSIPNAQSGAYRVTVSWNNNTMTRDLGNVYKIRGNEIPTINGFGYIDGNSTTVNVTGDSTRIVQNKSILKATFDSATGNYGASISSYKLECNGITKTGNQAGEYEIGTINSARDVDLKLTAYDSRGLSASKTITVKMVAYEPPKATVELKRLNNYEDETYLTVDGSVSSVLEKNTMTIKYRYKVSGGTYNNYVTIGDRAKQTLSLNKNNAYSFNVIVTDIFGSTFTGEYLLNKGVFPLFIDTVKNSVGVSKLPSKEEALELDGLLVTNPRGSINIEAGKTEEIVIDLNGGNNGTALVNTRIMGADLEIARLFYAFRSTQYFGVATPISEISFNNTASKVPCTIENTVAGLKFKFTNNHSSTVTVRYSIIEMC